MSNSDPVLTRAELLRACDLASDFERVGYGHVDKDGVQHL